MKHVKKDDKDLVLVLRYLDFMTNIGCSDTVLLFIFNFVTNHIIIVYNNFLFLTHEFYFQVHIIALDQLPYSNKQWTMLVQHVSPPSLIATMRGASDRMIIQENNLESLLPNIIPNCVISGKELSAQDCQVFF